MKEKYRDVTDDLFNLQAQREQTDNVSLKTTILCLSLLTFCFTGFKRQVKVTVFTRMSL